MWINPASAIRNIAAAYVSMSLACTSHTNYLPCFPNTTPGINSLISVPLHRPQSRSKVCCLQDPTFVPKTPSETVLLKRYGISLTHRKEKQRKKISILAWKTFCQKQLITTIREEHFEQANPQHLQFQRFMRLLNKLLWLAQSCTVYFISIHLQTFWDSLHIYKGMQHIQVF